MKIVYTNWLILLLLICSFSCKTKSETQKTDYLKEGYTRVTVKKYDVDGCGYMLFLDDNRKLNPVGLEEKYKKEGLVLWVKYTAKTNTITTCMAGTVVTVTEIIPASK